MADIITLAGNFKNNSELKNYCDAQYIAMQASIEKIKNLEEEIVHLQKLIAATMPIIGDSKITTIIKSPELTICEVQISILQNRALQKELTLEEVKILDLLIKNKLLLEKNTPALEVKKEKPKLIYDDAQLVQLAQIQGKASE